MAAPSNALRNKDTNEIIEPQEDEAPPELEEEEFDIHEFLRQQVREMPRTMMKRVAFLRHLQTVFNKQKMQHYRKVFEMEKEYHEYHKKVFDVRERIISGDLEPPPQKPVWQNFSPHNREKPAKLYLSNSINDITELSDDAKGIPDFWLSIFLGCPTLSQMVYEHDIPALQALRDVAINYDKEDAFTLEFHFNPNPYFSNEMLKKTYYLQTSYDRGGPHYSWDGLEIYKSVGCRIFWKEGMALNVALVRMRERHKKTGDLRTVMKEQPRRTFFNFFTRRLIDLNNYQNIPEELQETLRRDFEVGHYLRKQIIPKAVLYYSGDINDDDDDDDDDEDDDEEEDDGGEETTEPISTV